MKKTLFFCTIAFMGLSVWSCSKDDDNPVKDSGLVISSYQVISISGGKEYAKDVYTPMYDAQGRVVKTVYEVYSFPKGEYNLLTVEIRDFDYATSTAYATDCWEIITPGQLEVTGPDKLALKFGDGLKLLKVTDPDRTLDYTYNGDYLSSYSVTFTGNSPIVKHYTWSGGDLVNMMEEEITAGSGPYNINVTYGKEANPFVNTIDPLLAIHSSMLPEYASANLIGKSSAHLPVSYKEDFYGDITFSFKYTRDDKGRIVRVDITGDDQEHRYDRAIVISYSSL